ncbi:M64 family metallo-endopeptidase [Marinicella sp. S1101]|uniref:M64 family metallopeptidase n=1 Tax=Marinicella marina TaxID=2996016 RepID=UPI002260B575|nr:M64 family metallopeptidase [Marinicella marina]MCX7553104.1 M64 family metallo-endopeptidase [Marinicella marina]MDJ1138836.1 M64 family metallopeptidase [Marinicella marina]
MKTWVLFIIAVGLSFSSTAISKEADYLVLTWSEQNGLQAEYHQVFEWAEQSHSNNQHTSSLLAFDADDKLLEHVSIRDSQITRSEHHGHDHIDGQWLLNDKITFVVRAPKGQIKYLQLPASIDARQATTSFNSLVTNAKVKGPQRSSAMGQADNRVNLLIMSEGYTNAQQTDFNADVDGVIAYMQTFEPYQSYTNFVSYDRLFTASAQSGADKPADCFGGDAVTVNTAFDGSYCVASIRRLLTVNSTKIYTAAAAVPNWDEIIVIVNDNEYGGSGGAFSTFSTNVAANDIFIHEYGHSFTGLADEYDSPFPGFPACSDISSPSCEANVTDVVSRNSIKWNYLINQSTPVPTPETAQYGNDIGLFEGARYLETGMYRPKDFCNMRVLSAGFCAVCQEAYVLKIYDVLYADAGRLSLLEPDTASPAGATVSAMVSVPVNFSIDTLQPTHDLSITWSVNGSPQNTANSSLTSQGFSYTPDQVGANTVSVTVRDNSPLVHSSRQDELPEFEYVWQLDVAAFDDLIFADGFEP